MMLRQRMCTNLHKESASNSFFFSSSEDSQIEMKQNEKKSEREKELMKFMSLEKFPGMALWVAAPCVR